MPTHQAERGRRVKSLQLARLAIRCCQRSCILLLALSSRRVCRTTRRSTWQMKLQPSQKKIPMICSSVHHDETVSRPFSRHLNSPWFASAAEDSVDKEIIPCRKPFTWPTCVSRHCLGIVLEWMWHRIGHGSAWRRVANQLTLEIRVGDLSVGHRNRPLV